MSDLNPANHQPLSPVDDTQHLGHNRDSAERPLVQKLNLDTTPDTAMTASSKKTVAVLISVLAIASGVLTGFGAFKLNAKSAPSNDQQAPMQQSAGSSVKVGDVFGVQDEKTFKDSAQGYLEQGGIGGEGSHKLLRAGGETQTVVLTSSITDLEKLVGMEVKVWGETFKAQKAGWLMDVGRIEVINTEATVPTEE